MTDFSYFIDLSKVELAEGQKSTWLHAMPVGKVKHPIYGDIDFSTEALTGYANSVKTHVLGTVDPVIDYDHMAFNGIAAGWVKDAEVRVGAGEGDGLALNVEWTDEAVKRIKNKEYRYFSPTFRDEWEDQNGKKHKNVVFGGGITNRPYLKNLVPLNLSELTFGVPEPIEEGENEVDIKKLAKALGLSEDAGEEAVYAKLGELATPAPPPTPPAPPAPKVTDFQFADEIRQLAEKNPGVKNLLTTVESLVTNNREQAQQLRETAVQKRLGEFDNSQLVLTVPAKTLAYEIALKLDPPDQEKLFDLLGMMRDSNAIVVELGERGRTGASYVRDVSAEARFNAAWQKLVADEKMSVPDAMEKVAMENRALYDQYRAEVAIAQGV